MKIYYVVSRNGIYNVGTIEEEINIPVESILQYWDKNCSDVSFYGSYEDCIKAITAKINLVFEDNNSKALCSEAVKIALKFAIPIPENIRDAYLHDEEKRITHTLKVVEEHKECLKKELEDLKLLESDFKKIKAISL